MQEDLMESGCELVGAETEVVDTHSNLPGRRPRW